ncbi:DUF4253 domain-containing protein [Gordonia malaquae]|uniref:DUF4253 domain-containing protein n=1 Tax=Gordonia malaquae TaxID=410332 RepID=UPI0012F99D75|nr:DUF4253 domain-containing protein [Gordonia malaquae]
MLWADHCGTSADLDRLDLPGGQRFSRDTMYGARDFWIAEPGAPADPALWARALVAFSTSGYWPLLVPDDVVPDDIGGQEWFSNDWGPAGKADPAYLAHGADGPFSVIDEPFLAEWEATHTKWRRWDSDAGGKLVSEQDFLTEFLTGALDVVPSHFHHASPQATRSRLEPVSMLLSMPQSRIVLVPTTDPSMVPMVLDWGIANEELSPGRFASALRSWHRRFGVVLTSMQWSFTHLQCPAPPTSDLALDRLALELAVWATDSFWQGGITARDGRVKFPRAVVSEPEWTIWWD